MRQWIALCLLPVIACGMELSIQSGKEEGERYSILHLQNEFPFECSAQRNEFGEEKAVSCVFPSSPKHGFSPIDNPFFSVKGNVSDKGYAIMVTPKSKLKLIPLVFDLAREAQSYQLPFKSAKHWIVVGYSGTLPLIASTPASQTAINFPVKIEKNINPYVGGLDLKGNPIKIARIQDVTDYMEMKKAYQAKDYDKVLDLADNTLKHYPKTIFKNELMLYQIRALHEKGEYEQVIDLAKRFIRDYSSDANIAEILTYTANAYSKIGQLMDADYYFDRLFDEQSDSPFASQGMIYKAQQLEASGTPSRAKEYYQKALANTKDVAIASQAAFSLARMELESGNTAQAKRYIEKISSANPNYFNEVRPNAMEMITTFEDRNESKTASRITEALLNKTEKKTPDHELMLKNLGMQLAEAQKRDEALKRFNEYLSTYKYGEYVDEVRRAKDGLFFDGDDKNVSEQLKHYDDLISRYGEDSVGHKALYKKAELLFKEKRYKEVLTLEEELYRLDSAQYPNTTQMITQSAIGIEKQYLKEGKCNDAMSMQKMYKIRLMSEWDGLMFECAIKTTQYPLAKRIAQSHLKSKVIDERQLWLFRMITTQFGLGEYKEALKGGEELVSLLESQPNPKLNDIYRTMYDASQRSGDAMGMIRYIKSIEKVFPNDFKDIERYTQMVSLGLKQKDENIVRNYAQKVIALQGRTKTYTQTPFIEFTLVQSYQNLGDDAKALEVLKTLNGRKLSAEQRSRQQYLIGAVLQKMGKITDAKSAFNASIKADAASAWGKLAKDALGLL